MIQAQVVITLEALAIVALIGGLAGAALFFFRKWQWLLREWEAVTLFLPPSLKEGESHTRGYYFKNALQGEEEMSSTLKSWFNLPGSVNSLSVLLSLLTERSATRITEMLEELQHVAAMPEATQWRATSIQTSAPQLQERLFFTVMAYNVFSRNGDYTGVVVWFSDISRKARRVKRLQLENQRLKEDYVSAANILNALPFPVWQRDENLDIRFCNLAYSALVDSDTEQNTNGQRTLELTKQTKALATQALDSKEQQAGQGHVIVNGERRLFAIAEIPVPETNTLAGFAYDVTEREELENDLKRHIAAQSCLLESSASGMALFGFDTRLKIFNNAYVKLWGLDEAWLATQPSYSEILEVLREKRKLPEQANFPAFKKQHLTLFTDLQEPYNEFFYLPDGTALRVIVIPHTLGGLLFAYEDMTDKLAMERSYNTLIAVQRATLDNLHEGVAVFGQNGRLRLSNPMYAKLWNLEPRMLESEPHISHILDYTRPLYRYGDDWKAFKEEIITQATNRQPIQQCFERADGSVLEWIGVPLPDGAILMTYLDVTDSTVVERSLRERNEALEAADRIKTEFLANVSYELRSPLTTIIGFSEILRTYFKDQMREKELDYMEAIYNSSQHLMAIINDILDLASIEAGYMKLKLSQFDVATLLNSIAPLIRQRVKENQLIFRIRCSPDVGNMVGDEIRIKQVIFKLISNAIKFSAHKTMVVLGANTYGDDEVVIWVEDKGIGIPEEEQNKVFDKFYKSPGSRSSDPGTGLGLSMVKNFVQLHGGRIELQSTVGEGTKFLCYFKRQGIPSHEADNPLLLSHIDDSIHPLTS